MIINELPSWLPPFNLVVSVIAMVLTLLLMKLTKNNFALGAAVFVLVAGAAFQSNMIDLFMWTITGTGGRLVALGFIVTKLYLVYAHKRDNTTRL